MHFLSVRHRKCEPRQNQHFFSQKQTKLLLDWLHEALATEHVSDAFGEEWETSDGDRSKVTRNNGLHNERFEIQSIDRIVSRILLFLLSAKCIGNTML